MTFLLRDPRNRYQRAAQLGAGEPNFVNYDLFRSLAGPGRARRRSRRCKTVSLMVIAPVGRQVLATNTETASSLLWLKALRGIECK